MASDCGDDTVHYSSLPVFPVFFFCMIFLLLVSILMCMRSHSRRNSASLRAQQQREAAAAAGVDAEIFSHLPTFVYSEQNFGEAKVECSICISEIGEGERGRILPSCSHVFHMDCIDRWLGSHSTCPVCRTHVDCSSSNYPSSSSDSSVADKIVVTVHISPQT